ncbi:MAG: alpha-amylase family glycosyl hydrolase [Polyangiaceae bacterium]
MRALTLSAAVAIGMFACSSNDDASTTSGGSDAGADSQIGEGGTPTGDGGVVIPDYVSCNTTFHYLPPAGTTPTTVAVTGEWNGFATPGVAMTGPAADGSYSVDVAVPPAPLAIDSDQPGLVGYKLLVDNNYILDPAGRYRKYVGGVENSAVKVADCHVPELALIGGAIGRPAAGQGHYAARVKFVDTTDKHGVDPASIKVTIRKDGTETPVTFTQNGAEIDADVASLSDGKYSLFVNAKDKNGTAAHALRLVFWIESETYDWRDTVMWMGVTDRVKDGDPTNDAPPTSGIDPRVDFQGGDYEGIRQIIHAGTLDQMGIRAIWLTPFNTNPNDSWVASDGVHQTMGYHGYWPMKPRDVDARFGGATELHALVTEAHAHGIRVIQDFVVNHVHQEHDYFKNHPEWFRTGCICGTDNCDWTTHRLDCLFATYLPDVNWTVPDVSEQYMADAKYWLDAFDIDGLRFDAVKHVEDAATLNMTSSIRDEFEASGTKVFMTGETAMGWSNCGLTCNDDQYSTIAHYIGDPTKGGGGLDGQFDFVTYYAVPMTAWDKDNGGGTHMPHADYWTQASGWEYPQGAIMSQYVGSQDTARFVTIASYRGQDGAHDPSIP